MRTARHDEIYHGLILPGCLILVLNGVSGGDGWLWAGDISFFVPHWAQG